jgi:hypothetical protein
LDCTGHPDICVIALLAALVGLLMNQWELVGGCAAVGRLHFHWQAVTKAPKPIRKKRLVTLKSKSIFKKVLWSVNMLGFNVSLTLTIRLLLI